MRESCLVYCYSGIQSLFEVVLLYTFYTLPLNYIIIFVINILSAYTYGRPAKF